MALRNCAFDTVTFSPRLPLDRQRSSPGWRPRIKCPETAR